MFMRIPSPGTPNPDVSCWEKKNKTKQKRKLLLSDLVKAKNVEKVKKLHNISSLSRLIKPVGKNSQQINKDMIYFPKSFFS